MSIYTFVCVRERAARVCPGCVSARARVCVCVCVCVSVYRSVCVRLSV